MENVTERVSKLEEDLREVKDLLRLNFPRLFPVKTTTIAVNENETPTTPPVTTTPSIPIMPMDSPPVNISSTPPVTTTPSIEIIQNSETDLRCVGVKHLHQAIDARLQKFAESKKKKRQAQEDQRKREEEENERKRQKNV